MASASWTYNINLKVSASPAKVERMDSALRKFRSALRLTNSALKTFQSNLEKTSSTMSTFNGKLSRAASNAKKLTTSLGSISKISGRNGFNFGDGFSQKALRNVKQVNGYIDDIGRKSRYTADLGSITRNSGLRNQAYVSDYSRQQKSGRAISRFTEKSNRLADIGMMAGGYLGFSSLKKYLIDTPAQAQTQKWLLSTMGDNTASKETLYGTLDKTTDRLPISMQSVAQPLYAFKAASGANAETINKMIPQFANFGAVVQNMTGSTELAETAMMKLSYGLQGKYAALDQYGITEAALKREGWSGDETDIEGYMNAVTKIVGNAEDSMSTFTGKTKLLDKAMSRAGKRMWEGGLGSALTMLVDGVSDLLNVGDGAGGQFALLAGGLSAAFMAIISGGGYAIQALASFKEAMFVSGQSMAEGFRRITGKLNRTKTLQNAENLLASRKELIANPVISQGIFDYNKQDMRNAGFSKREQNDMQKRKRKTNKFIDKFGYSDLVQQQIAAVPKTKGRAKAVSALKRSYKNEIAGMGFMDRTKTAWSSLRQTNGIGGSIKGLVSSFSLLVGVVNPVTIAVAGLGAALAALAGIFLIAYTSSESFRQHVGGVADKLKQLGGTFVNMFGDVLNGLGLSSETGVDAIVDVAEKILSCVENIVDATQALAEAIANKDYTAEGIKKEGTKKRDEAQAKIDEATKTGKKVDPEWIQQRDWGQSRIDYVAEGGEYWNDKSRKIEREYGVKLTGEESSKDLIKIASDLALGRLNLDGVGKRPEEVNETTKKYLEGKQSNTNYNKDYETRMNDLTQKRDMDSFWQYFGTMIGGFNPGLGMIMGGINDVINSAITGDLGNALSGGLDSIFNNINPSLDLFSANVDTKSQEAYGKVSTNANNAAPQAMMATQQLGLFSLLGLDTGMSGMGNTASSKAGEIPPAISSQSGAAHGASSQVASSANSGVQNVDLSSPFSKEVGFIKDKILAGIPDVISAVGQMVNAANQAVTDNLRQRSPGFIARSFGKEVNYAAMLVSKNTPNLLHSIVDMVRSSLHTYTTENKSVDPFSIPITTNLDSYLKQQSLNYQPNLTTTQTPTANPNINQPLQAPTPTPDNRNVTLTFNIEKVDSEERVKEIEETVHRVLFWNNETHGRQEPAPIVQ